MVDISEGVDIWLSGNLSVGWEIVDEKSRLKMNGKMLTD
jgi:hypothetical protein